MKYFLLEGKHLVPFKELEHLVPEHHTFLKRGYDEGHFLFSGPQVPPHGGFLVARAKSKEDLDAFLAGEPFVREGKMEFIRVTEFEAAQCQDLLNAWFGK
jgi:uncharacterized protein YciI